MNARWIVFFALLAAGLLAERDPRFVLRKGPDLRPTEPVVAPVPGKEPDAASVTNMPDAGRLALSGLKAGAKPPRPSFRTAPWSLLAELGATASRAEAAAVGAVARVEARALVDALAAQNQRMDGMLAGMRELAGALAKATGEDEPAADPVAEPTEAARALPETTPVYPGP